MRNLATIQKIEELNLIPGADAIETASILGWKVVVKKGEFVYPDDDICVYCEIDSLLPEREEFEFLRSKKFRISSIKLRGQISQGIAFPLSILPKEWWDKYEGGLKTDHIGMDVTQILGIKLYEPPEVKRRRKLNIQSAGYVMRRITTHPFAYIFFIPVVFPLVKNFWKKQRSITFPTHLVPQTDELRIQSYPWLLKEIQGKDCVATVKIDGTSVTYILYDGEFLVCSRNRIIHSPWEDCFYDSNVYWSVAIKKEIEKKMRDLSKKYNNRDFAIQGEIAGSGIQKNRLNLKEHELFIFNIYDIHHQRYLADDAMRELSEIMGLIPVPVARHLDNFNSTVDELLELAKGKYESGYDREGIVIRPIVEQYSEALRGRLSFKVINNDYLLKGND